MASSIKTQSLEPFTMETLILQKKKLHEIKFFFYELNIIKVQIASVSFNTLLELISKNKETYIKCIKSEIETSTIFLQRLCKDICTNPFEILDKTITSNCVCIFT